MQEAFHLLGLATIRQNRGISLEAISGATKISVRLLEAIERGDFKKLPGGLYNTSYIRQYARAIDYDETTILAHYHAVNPGANPVANAESNGKSMVGGLRAPSMAGN